MLDWNEIQKYYDNNHTINECMKKFNIKSATSFSKARKRGVFKTRCKSSCQIKNKTKPLDNELVKFMYHDKHLSYREISKILNISIHYIRKIIKNPRTLSEAAKINFNKNGPNIPNNDYCKKLSRIMSENNRGGKSKWFIVNNIRVQGTWERDFALWLIENNIEWIRPKSIKYKMYNKIKRYTPDFYLPTYNVFIEIKGYWWGNDKEKMSCVINQHNDKLFLIIEDKNWEKYISKLDYRLDNPKDSG